MYKWYPRIEYYKTAMVYFLYPLLGMIEVYLVTPIKHKLLTAIPYIINCVLVLSDLLFDTHIVFYFIASYASVAEILVYYFFLAAISYSETQKKLYESRIELEQENIRLMTAQIQPHFIFNSLSTLQMLCYRDGKATADLIVVFGNYLRANIDSLESDKPIPFHTELEHIDQFISIIRAGNKTKFDVIYDLQTESFTVPLAPNE